MIALSKNKIKQIVALSTKKHRDEAGLFVAEGTKLVMDMLSVFHGVTLVASSIWFDEHPTAQADEMIEATPEEFKKITNQKSPQGVMAIFKKPQYSVDIDTLSGKLTLALDDVQDPGNLGTIIRIADWFGIADVFCSPNCADVFGPKTVQATMGALARVRVHYVHLPDLLKQCQRSGLPVYGTFMDGDDVYEKSISAEGVIVMGNEGNGISSDIEKFVTDKLLIPNYPKGMPTSESLNVGVATAIICAEFRRRK